MKALTRTILAAGLFALAASSAHAAIVKVSMDFMNLSGDISALDPTQSTPTSFNFTAFYDSTTPGMSDPSVPDFALFAQPFVHSEVTINGIKLVRDNAFYSSIYMAFTGPANTGNGLSGVIDIAGGFEERTISTGPNAGLATSVYGSFASLRDFDGSVGIDPSVPILPAPYPVSWDAADRLVLQGEVCTSPAPCDIPSNPWNVSGDVDLSSITSMIVPEPTTLALFGIGLAGLGLAARRRKTER